jgi:hypothetical protein
MVTAGLAYAGPLIIKQIMIFVTNKKAIISDQNAAYNSAAIWVLLYFAKIFIH